MWRKRFVAVSFLLLLPVLLAGQGLEYIKANYTKHEYRIPMRDGVHLYTAAYLPKDTSKSYPILLLRTPYSLRPYGVDNYYKKLGPSPEFAKDKFIFVYQDVRGRYMSEGTYVQVRPHNPNKSGPGDIDESSDTYDTIEWLIHNVPNNNGRVGMWGISYPGFYAAAALPGAHPALRAVSPQAPVIDWFIGDDFHHNGAFFLAHCFRWMSGNDRVRPGPTKERVPRFKYPTPNGYEFFLHIGPLSSMNKVLKRKLPFWDQMMEHPNYDEFWRSRVLLPYFTNVTPAVLAVGGWFDAEDVYGPMHVYHAIEKANPGAENLVVYGPWYHGGWAGSDGEHLGQVHFGSKTAEFFRKQIQFPFFRHHLKQTDAPELPDAYMFETGTNQWRRFETWPPDGVKPVSFYFREGGKLSREAPRAPEGFDKYTSDPSKPVPFIDYTATGMTREYMVDDQRFASTRPDVLVYETEPLEKDFTIAGPITASLRVSTTGTDADFIVKLIDVYPPDYPDPKPNPKDIRMGTYQQLVRGEPFRGRFRNSFEKPEPFRPGEVTKVEFVLPDLLHTFRRGHRIMVQVQSTWFPLVDRNPQQFIDIYHATESDFRKADQCVYRSAKQPSFIKVNVLGRE